MLSDATDGRRAGHNSRFLPSFGRFRVADGRRCQSYDVLKDVPLGSMIQSLDGAFV